VVGTGAQLVRRWPDDPATRAWLGAPRNDLVREEPAGADGRFGQAEGPFEHYERHVAPGDGELVETVRWRVAIPWFRWLFAWPIRAALRQRSPHRVDDGRQPWWAPPDRLTPHHLQVLGLLAAASMASAFVNTLFTQTVAFASDDFGVGDWGRGVAGTVVRLGILLGLPFAFAADRVGRRRVVVLMAWLAPTVSALGAAAPTFEVLVATQAVGRPLGLALDVLIAVIAAEEMPRSSRAYAVSVLAMASGLGAGVAVASLPLADLSSGSWRLVYLVALVWLPVALDLTRRLPETSRFRLHQADVADGRPAVPRLRRSRLAVQAAVAFAGNLLVAPTSFFQNSYLKNERGFSAGMVTVFVFATTAPAVVGLIAGGRVADFRGRRRVAAVCVPAGAVLVVVHFSVAGVPMWLAALVGGTVASAAYPALAVYRAELFPTGNRGRAASLILASALVGGSIGLLLAGWLLDRGASYGQTMGLLLVGPAVVAVLVLATYPETAHRELEELNPEDAHPA
jgi:MFS family permease